jgi:outer membrane immunogenic protein
MYTRLLVTVASTALAITFATKANSADVRPMPVIQKAPPVYLPPPPQWNGWYVGGHVGVGWFDQDISGDFVQFGRSSFSTSTDAGVVGGVHGGYNWQFAPQWLVGIEGDFDFTSMRASAAGNFGTNRFITASTHVDWLSSVRGRVGYLWTPGLLIYGTAGFAMADVDYQAHVETPGLIAGVSRTTTKDGFVAGAGVEYMWSREWLVRAEYLFYDFGSSTRSFAVVPASVHWDNLNISTVRLGASYKF